MTARLAAAALLLVCAACSRPRTPTPDDGAERARIAGEAVRTRTRGAGWRCSPMDVTPLPSPATRAERTGYCETTSYEEAMAFLDSVKAKAAPNRVMTLTRLGASPRGRPLYVVTTCARSARGVEQCDAFTQAPRKRPVVLVQANIHAGEVEGKEAVLALLRRLVTDSMPNLLDSLTLMVVPVYNADGNEALGPQSRNRTEQLGPAIVGERPNGSGLDLNRDYIKSEAPETRAMLPLLTGGGVDVFVDLHTTNGSYHGYNLTWAPSLHPGAPLGQFTSDTLLAGVRLRLLKQGLQTYPYGNFSTSYERSMSVTPVKEGWFTYDSRPRFGTNYFGLTGGVAVLSEAFSHDPFGIRVSSTFDFVRELLGTVARDQTILARVTAARRALTTGTAPRGVILDTRLTTNPFSDSVVVEELALDPDSAGVEPGVPLGVKRTGRYRKQWMPVKDRFEATLATTVPAGGWLIEAKDSALMALLGRHGVEVRPSLPLRRSVEVERFRLDSIARANNSFQGHREVKVQGLWLRMRMLPSADYRWVPATQRQSLIAAQLLEPQSNDGATTWNYFDDRLLMGKYHPVLRVVSRLPRR
jgi:hypothetical protein